MWTTQPEAQSLRRQIEEDFARCRTPQGCVSRVEEARRTVVVEVKRSARPVMPRGVRRVVA